MGEIKFRGKTIIDGQEGENEWVYGHYCKITGKHFIVPEYADCDWEEEDVWSVQGLVEVQPETLGQATGFKFDDDKTECYDGDLCQKHEGESILEVMWIEKSGGFKLYDNENKWFREISFVRVCHKTGDIHTSP